MEILKEIVRNIVVIILLTTFLNLLLPSSSMQRFVKVVMGLFIMVSLLNPILSIFSNKEDFEVFAWQQNSIGGDEGSLSMETGPMSKVNQEMFLENYARQLEAQMAALVKLIKGVENVDVQVVLVGGKRVGTVESIKSVTVMVNGKEDKDIKPGIIEPIKIDVNEVKIEGGDQGGAIDQQTLNSISVPEKSLSDWDKRIKSEITDTICQYFSLNPDQIKVAFAPGEVVSNE